MLKALCGTAALLFGAAPVFAGQLTDAQLDRVRAGLPAPVVAVASNSNSIGQLNTIPGFVLKDRTWQVTIQR